MEGTGETRCMESVGIPAAVEPQGADPGVEIQKLLRPEEVVGELLHWKAGIFHPKIKANAFRAFEDIEII